MFCTKILKGLGDTGKTNLRSRLYSRKSSSKYSGPFKVISNSHDDFNELASHQFIQQANWELFSPPGFRFYMPGSVGPAWHDHISAELLPTTVDPLDNVEELECTIQDCPILLRQAVLDIFPGLDANSSTLTVLTLSQKGAAEHGSDQEIERLTRRFMLLAQDICGKLKLAGFWADFINPFSGAPYLSPLLPARVGRLKEKQPNLLGFRVDLFNGCRVIDNNVSRRFLGSVFTSAPANASTLHDVIEDYEYSWKK